MITARGSFPRRSVQEDGVKTILGWCCVGVLAWTCLGCGSGAPTYPNAPVILISVDTLRADHLPAYGYDAIKTPNIDVLAQDGVVFTHAFSHVPLTLPSHSSLFTGLLPGEHGVRDNLGFHLDDAYETLAERLKTHGYQTAGVVSAMVLRQETGVAQGFDTYDDDFFGDGTTAVTQFAERRGDASLERLQTWLAQHAQGPFFAFFHLFEPHAPYAPPARDARRFFSRRSRSPGIPGLCLFRGNRRLVHPPE